MSAGVSGRSLSNFIMIQSIVGLLLLICSFLSRSALSAPRRHVRSATWINRMCSDASRDPLRDQYPSWEDKHYVVFEPTPAYQCRVCIYRAFLQVYEAMDSICRPSRIPVASAWQVKAGKLRIRDLYVSPSTAKFAKRLPVACWEKLANQAFSSCAGNCSHLEGHEPKYWICDTGRGSQ